MLRWSKQPRDRTLVGRGKGGWLKIATWRLAHESCLVDTFGLVDRPSAGMSECACLTLPDIAYCLTWSVLMKKMQATSLWPSSKTKTTQVQSWFHFAFLAIFLPNSVDVFSLHCFALENAMFPWRAQKRYYDLSIKKFVLEARPSLLA